MKISSLLPFAFLLSSAAGQSLGDLVGKVPACAYQCVVPAFVACNATDVPSLAACLCTDNARQRNVTSCVIDQLQVCNNWTSILNVLEVDNQLCRDYPQESKVGQVVVAAIALLAVTTPFVILRAVSRLGVTKQLWWDDYTLLAAYIVLVANLAVTIAIADLGLGKHLWDVHGPNIISILKLFYVIQLAYIGTQVLVKCSLLLFFLRIFPQKWFRYATFAIIGFLILHGLIFIFIVVFQCMPIHLFWNRTIPGYCYNQQAFTYAGAAFSILEDFVILLLPIPCLKRLNIRLGQKIALAIIFSFGSLACVASIIRLKYLNTYGELTDATWDNVPTGIWSQIENSIAVICACLPTLRPLLSRLLPQFFQTSANRSTALGSLDPISTKERNTRMDVVITTKIEQRLGSVDEPHEYTAKASSELGSDEIWAPPTTKSTIMGH